MGWVDYLVRGRVKSVNSEREGKGVGGGSGGGVTELFFFFFFFESLGRLFPSQINATNVCHLISFNPSSPHPQMLNSSNDFFLCGFYFYKQVLLDPLAVLISIAFGGSKYRIYQNLILLKKRGIIMNRI